MRKTLLNGHKKMLVFLLFLGLAMVIPQQAFSQSGRYTFGMQDVTLKEIISEIQRISNYDFVYSDVDISNVPRRTVNFKEAAIGQILSETLSGTGLESQINGTTVVIRKSATPRQAPRPISGRVTDHAGRPVIGATVSVKGTSIGAVADANGRYEIRNVPAGEQALIFSFMGMESQEIKLGAQISTMNATMKEGSTVIGDVVVTGIFNRAREGYTGSVTEISSKEIGLHRGQNLARTLANIDPSFNLAIDNVYGSDPNRLPDITIRGDSSLPTSLKDLNEGVKGQLNTPLIIMDGFEVSLTKLMDFNDEDVENINILKDASATAIYGSRGANGVIVIVTKRPSEGKLRIQLQAGLNIEIPDLSSYDMLNAREKLEVERMAGMYNHLSPIRDIERQQAYSQVLEEIRRGVDTDWLSKPLRTGVGQKYNLRMDWGAEQLQVTASLSYNNVMGVMKGSKRNIFNGGITLYYKYKNITFSNHIAVDINKSDNGTYGKFSDYVEMNPYWRTHNEKGILNKEFYVINANNSTSAAATARAGNPLYNATLNSIDQSKYDYLSNNFAVEWAIFDGLVLRGQLGLSKGNSSTDIFIPPSHTMFDFAIYQTAEGGRDRIGTYDYTTTENFNMDTRLTLNYSKVFNDKHLLYAGFDYSMSNKKELGFEFYGEGFDKDRYDFFPNALRYKEDSTPKGRENIIRAVGFTGTFNYVYDNKYFIDGSYRLDGSSLFGSKNKFAPFWSAGIGWNLHNENFLKGNKTINRLKIKGSVGVTGTQNFSPHQALSTFNMMTGEKYINWVGSEMMGLGNEKLKWQTTIQYNVGLEVAFLQNRIEASLDIYKKRTKDQLSALNITTATGFNSYVANIGEVENSGFEASLMGYIIRNTEKDMIWSVTGRIAYNKNEITKLSDNIKAQNEIFKDQNSDIALMSYLLEEGKSTNSIYAVTSLGIDPSTGREIFLDKDGEITSDYNGNARKYCGLSQPKYRGNISTYFSYKNLSINLSFAYHWGGQMYNKTLRDKVEVTNTKLQKNADRRIYTDRWQKPGDVKFFKGFGESATYTPFSSRFVMNDNMFQLQTINISYRLKPAFLQKSGIESLRVSLNMSDVFHLSSVKLERGTSYPFSRKTGLTISLTF